MSENLNINPKVVVECPHPETAKLGEMKKRNNPNNEPTGHYTGRCSKCGSNDLWDDNLAYGCNCCGAILLGCNS